MQFLSKHGYTELKAGGNALIMNELVVEYKSESFYGDILDVALYPGDITRVSFELFYQVTTFRDQKREDIALAKTGMVGYDYQKKSLETLTKELKAILM